MIVGGYESLFITSMSRQSVFEKVEGVIHTFSTFVKHLTMSSELRETAESMMFSLQHHGSKFDCLKVRATITSCHLLTTHNFPLFPQHYDIAFASPREGGKLELAYFDFLKQENGDWAVNQFKTSATFKQMPNYIIKTEQKSKKTFFSSKSSIEQTIVYVDPGANVDDIKALMFMTMPPSLLLPGVLPEGALSHK